MNEELLIESANRQEVSKLKETLKGYAMKWPWMLLCVCLTIGLAFIYLKFKPNMYQVKSKVLIKKSNQFSDPNELLFGGRANFGRFGKISDETTIFGSFPLVRSTLESLNFDVSYKINDGFKEVEIYKESPVIFDFDREKSGKLPLAITFTLEKLTDNDFELTTNNTFEGETINGKFQLGQPINLGSFQFKIMDNPLGKKASSSKTYFIRLSSLDALTYSYQNTLSFGEVEAQSFIMTMSMKTRVPQKSIDFINTLTEHYIEQNLIDKNKVAENTVAFIDQQLAVISDSLTKKEQNLENFKSTESMSGLSATGGVIMGQYNEIEKEKAVYEVKKQYFDYLKKNLNQENNGEVQNLIAPSAFGIQDLVVNNLVNSLIELNFTKTRIEKDENVKSPLYAQVTTRIEEVKKTLNESIDNLSDANQIILNKLNNRASKLMADAKKLPGAERKLVNLNRLLQLNENIYLFLMEKRSSAAITKSSNTPDCKVIEPAMLNPLNPVAPKRKIVYLMAILIGAILPLAFFVLLDFLNDTIRDKEDVKSSTQIPILGYIPKSKRTGSYLTLSENPKSALAESFRIIRTNLSFFRKKENSYLVLLTSSVSREGKTFCAINLASALAATGKKTIVLGFDLRKPQIHNYLELENGEGVSNYLIGDKKLDQVVKSTKQENLFVINSGPIPPNPAELIGADKTKQLIEKLREEFDFIILDTPPVGLVADALLLQQYADLSLYVIRQNYSKREFLTQINELYTSGKIQNMSLLMNDVEKGATYHYGYYEEETKSSKLSFLKNRS